MKKPDGGQKGGGGKKRGETKRGEKSHKKKTGEMKERLATHGRGREEISHESIPEFSKKKPVLKTVLKNRGKKRKNQVLE